MNEMKGQGGELRAILHITRKATGKVDTVELVGRTTPEEHAKIMGEQDSTNQSEENTNGSHS